MDTTKCYYVCVCVSVANASAKRDEIETERRSGTGERMAMASVTQLGNCLKINTHAHTTKEKTRGSKRERETEKNEKLIISSLVYFSQYAFTKPHHLLQIYYLILYCKPAQHYYSTARLWLLLVVVAYTLSFVYLMSRCNICFFLNFSALCHRLLASF